MMKQIDDLLSQTKAWFDTLTYEMKCLTVTLSIVVVFPILVITKLIFGVIAFALLVGSVKVFQYGKEENDLFYLFPTVMLAFIAILVIGLWIAITFRAYLF